MDRRTGGEPEDRQADQPGVVVHDVEFVSALQEGQKVLELPIALADVLTRRRLEGRDQRRFRRRVPGGEQGHVDAGVDEPVGEKLDDCLDTAVPVRRYGEPDGAEERDAHQ